MIALCKNKHPSGNFLRPILWEPIITIEDQKHLDKNNYKKVESDDPIWDSPIIKEYVNDSKYKIYKSNELIFGRYSLILIPIIECGVETNLAKIFRYDYISKGVILLAFASLNDGYQTNIHLNRITGEAIVDNLEKGSLDYIGISATRDFEYHLPNIETCFKTIVTCGNIVMLCDDQHSEGYCIKTILFKKTIISSEGLGSENITIKENYPTILTKKYYHNVDLELNLAAKAFRSLTRLVDWQSIEL